MKLQLSIKDPAVTIRPRQTLQRPLMTRPRQLSIKDPAVTIRLRRTLQMTANDKAAQLSIKDPGRALEEALSFLLTALAIVLSYT